MRTWYLKRTKPEPVALAALLEVRPSDPVSFLASHFKQAVDPEDPENAAFHLIRVCPRSRHCFEDNLYRAFERLLRGQRSSVTSPFDDSGVRGSELVNCAGL